MTEEITYPDLVIPFEASFTSPIDKVWACISDFGGWGKWYSHYTECKVIGDGIAKIGAIAKAISAKTNVTYEIVLLVRDPAEHTYTYGVVRRDPHIPWIKNQVNSYCVVSIGENESQVTGTITVTPNCQVSEEAFEQYKSAVLAGFKSLFSGLEEYLNSQKQSSQN